MSRWKRILALECILFLGAFCAWRDHNAGLEVTMNPVATVKPKEKDYIKWVDFNVSSEALQTAYEMDRDTYGQAVHLNWIELLAFAAAKQGGNLKKSVSTELKALKEKLCEEKMTMDELTKDMQAKLDQAR